MAHGNQVKHVQMFQSTSGVGFKLPKVRGQCGKVARHLPSPPPPQHHRVGGDFTVHVDLRTSSLILSISQTLFKYSLFNFFLHLTDTPHFNSRRDEKFQEVARMFINSSFFRDTEIDFGWL
jgi:hypothetical protein